MDSARWHEVERIFHAALELPVQQRHDFLLSETDGAPDIEAEVSSLLANDDPEFLLHRGGLPAPDSGSKIGPYRIESEIGRGGMGVVYKAIDERLDRPVAIKFLTQPLLASESERKRLRGEARLLAQCNHPNIATIYGIESTADGRQFLVLEFVEGESLAARLRRGAIESQVALRIAGELASALRAAHARGVIHRDLKPDNVLIDPEGSVKVVDFGLACDLRGEDDGEGAMIAGTPGYMSPEQLSGSFLDQRSDIFAFGCLLYECLAGDRAFEGTTLEEVRESTLRGYPDLRKLDGTATHSIRELIADCLSKDVSDRPLDLELIETRLSAADENAFDTGDRSELTAGLPIQVDTFVGRDAELVALCELRKGTRLLSLVGPGGSGKTRLALEAIRRQLAASSDGDVPAGIHFVDLAPVGQGDRVATVLLESLGVPDDPSRLSSETAIREFGDQSHWVLFDNCEQVVDAVGELAMELTTRCPGLLLWATSRSPLDVAGETCFSVHPLGAEGTDSDAVRLFEDRARAARPGFRLTRDNLSTVSSICAKVEGIPLAVELVAARIRALPPEELLRRLEQSFDIVSRAREGSGRQRTLRSTFEWSFELLGAEERAVLGRISVFAGGFTLEAAEAVASDSNLVPKHELLNVLTSLVEKSLVQQRSTRTGAARYRMLEPERQFAEDKLGRGDDAFQVRRRHLGYFLELVEGSSDETQAPGSASWVEYIGLDSDNIHEAIEWGIEIDEEIVPASALCAAMYRYWSLAAGGRTGFDLVRRALDRCEESLDPRVRASLYYCGGVLANERNESEIGLRWLEEGLALQRRLGLRVGHFMGSLGHAATRHGDQASARKYFEEAAEEARQRGDVADEYGTLIDLGNLAITEGDYEEAAKIYRTILDPNLEFTEYHRAVAYGNASYLHGFSGQFELALEFADAAHALATEAGMLSQVSRAEINAGRALHYLGRLDEAESRLRSALESFRELEIPFFSGFAIAFLLPVLLAKGDAAEREDLHRLYEEGLRITRDAQLVDLEILCRTSGAEIALQEGDLDEAVARSRRAVELLATRTSLEGAEEDVLWTHARILRERGELAEYEHYLAKAATELRTKADRFESQELRAIFLGAIPSHRDILREFKDGSE